MIKLFQNQTLHKGTYWCFAPSAKTAIKIFNKEIFDGKRRQLKVTDVTKDFINEDGVKFLIDHQFVGIPKRAIFMLNGSMSAMDQHYNQNHRSATLWWSEKIPGSRELWN